jgi:ABC-2 type transport system ATP-binding protein
MTGNGEEAGGQRADGLRQARENGNETAIEIRGLVKRYGPMTAVNGISLDIRRGEVFAFLGPNGAGKTTTVEMVETIRTPSAGTIRILGMDVTTETEALKRVIGVMPQEFSSMGELKVRETLEYYSSFYDRHADSATLLKLMDLEEHAEKLYKHLSGGLKQRVGIAVALVNDPEVVFLDEPTTGLDPTARHEVWKVIAGLRERGKTVFLTTHYMEEAEELADHIAIISHGRIIAEGSLEELVERYGSGFNIIFKGTNDNFAPAMKGLGLEVEGNNGKRLIRLRDKDELLRVLAGLKERNVKFKEFNVHRSDLEEVFLKLTGEKLQGGAAA